MKRICQSILAKYGKQENYRLGATKVLYREGVDAQLEALRKSDVEKRVIIIQALARRFIVRRKILRMHRSVRRIQNFWRQVRMSKMKERQTRAALAIQSLFRGVKARKIYRKKRSALIQLQTALRIRLSKARISFLLKQSKANTIDISQTGRNQPNEKLTQLTSKAENLQFEKTLDEFVQKFNKPSSPEEKQRWRNLGTLATAGSKRIYRPTSRPPSSFNDNLDGFEFSKFLAIFGLPDTGSNVKSTIMQPILSKVTGSDKDIAIAVFRNLLILMGDLTKNDDAIHPLDRVTYIISNGVENEIMRDEVYAQLMKQMTNNPSAESILAGTNILKTCIHFFAPSETILKYLAKFLVDTIPAPMNDFLLSQLERCVQNGSRTEVPYVSEILSVLVS
jgi:hypothetical protein